MKKIFILLSTSLFLSSASAISLPKGYIVPKETVSPSGRYGFMVPVLSILAEKEHVSNALVSMKNGKVITTVEAFPGFDRSVNYIKVAVPWWSQDESLVLWRVDGKWAPSALVLIKLKNEVQLWQLNVLTTFEQRILASTKKAVSPKKYEAVKKFQAGCGSAYPEGFTINVEPVMTEAQDASLKQELCPPLQLPLSIHVTLTSNPKKIPRAPNINAEMDGVIKEGGIVEVSHFKLLP